MVLLQCQRERERQRGGGGIGERELCTKRGRPAKGVLTQLRVNADLGACGCPPGSFFFFFLFPFPFFKVYIREAVMDTPKDRRQERRRRRRPRPGFVALEWRLCTTSPVRKTGLNESGREGGGWFFGCFFLCCRGKKKPPLKLVGGAGWQ